MAGGLEKLSQREGSRMHCMFDWMELWESRVPGLGHAGAVYSVGEQKEHKFGKAKDKSTSKHDTFGKAQDGKEYNEKKKKSRQNLE